VSAWRRLIKTVFFIPLGISALCFGFRDAVAPTFDWLLLLFEE
jgi:hypothetical protein